MYSETYQVATKALKAVHLQDPNIIECDSESIPAEWIYTQRLVDRLTHIYPDASEALSIATFCQHLYRWKIKRNQYPQGRAGYHQWRNYLSEYQAEKAAVILEKSGYSSDFISKVVDIQKKFNIHELEDAQKLEDVVCLVFLEYYLNDFIKGKTETQLIQIVQKTWNKMSNHGHQIALKLNLSEPSRKIIEQALD